MYVYIYIYIYIYINIYIYTYIGWHLSRETMEIAQWMSVRGYLTAQAVTAKSDARTTDPVASEVCYWYCKCKLCFFTSAFLFFLSV